MTGEAGLISSARISGGNAAYTYKTQGKKIRVPTVLTAVGDAS